jgi:polar amino acid transport system ATP-binding protein
MSALLTIRNLYKSYAQTPVLKGVDLEVAAGEVVVIIGPSGSGKSTLLSCVNFLEPFDSGEIAFNGRPVGYGPLGAGTRLKQGERELNRLRRDIGMVFQQFNLFPHFSVLANLMEAPVRVLGRPATEVRVEAERLLAKVGLAHKAAAYPRELSGGQQQRVAIARALAMQPQLMLFDEVTSALDPELKGEVLRVMRTLAVEGMTMLVVTHEMQFAREVADRVVFMEDGRVVETASAAAFFDAPQQARTREFIASIQST